MSLFGGLAAASLGGIALSQAAEPQLPVDAGELDTVTKTALDKTDAEFSQVVVRRPYRRPVIVRRRVVVRRPRPYYRRPVVVRRRVIVR